VVDDPDDDAIPIATGRTLTPTEPIQTKSEAIEIDLDDPESAAQFLEHVARLVRVRKKLRILIE